MRKLILVLACVIIAGSTIANADEKLVDLVKKVKPSVVLIETFYKDNKPIGRGSGFFIDNKGSLITNHHVIEGAYSATIKTSAGKEYPVQGIVAKDTEADIVKLVVNLPDANMTFLNLSVNVPSEGEDIFVIGNPLGLESTVSSGIVSAVRDIPAFGKILQITAPISPGSSGSPVINSKGEVIGIATLIVTKGQNLNFAILSDKIIALKETSKAALSESYASLTTDANDAQKLIDKGLKELWQENWSAALTYFKKAAEKNPQDANAWSNAGYCYGELGRGQEAIEACKRAIKIKPDDAEAHYNLGVTYGELGRYEDEMEAYKQTIRIKPDYDKAHCNLGAAYGNIGRYQEAIEAFKQAIRIKPDDAKAHCNLGISYGHLGRWKEAIEAFKQTIKIKPDYADAHCNLGAAYDSLGRYQEAIDASKQAIRIKPDYAEAYYNLGVTYGKLGRYQEAIEAYKQAIRIKPDYAEAHCGLGLAYGNLGRFQDAIEACKQAIKIKPDYADAHYNLGAAYHKLGRGRKAIEACKQAIKIKPDYAEAHYGLGAAYGMLDRWQETIEPYKQAIRIKPDYADAHYNLGVTYDRLGRYQEAIEAFKKYIKIKPDDVEAHWGLGNAYLKTGDKGSALEEYKILKPLDAKLAYKLFNLIYKIAGSTIANADEKLVDSVKCKVKPSVKCEAKPSVGLIVFICASLVMLVVIIVTRKSSVRSNSSPEALQTSVQPSTSAPSIQILEEENKVTKRSIFLRTLFGFLWFIPIYLLSNMIIGGIVGAFAGASTKSFEEGYNAGRVASIDFFQKYGLLIFLAQVILTLLLSVIGFLPGTGRYKKIKTIKSGSFNPPEANKYGKSQMNYLGGFIIFAIICGILCGVLGSVVFFVKSVHIFAVRNAPIVTGHIIAREPFLYFKMPRTDFTIRIDGTQTEVHAYPPETEIPEVVRFHYSGDPAREVFLFEYEEPYYWITLFYWGGTSFLVVILVVECRSAYIRKAFHF